MTIASGQRVIIPGLHRAEGECLRGTLIAIQNGRSIATLSQPCRGTASGDHGAAGVAVRPDHHAVATSVRDRPFDPPAVCDTRAMSLIERSDSVLIVIDAQPGFSGALRRGGRSRDALARGRRLADRGRAAMGVPVVVTEEDADRNGPTDSLILDRLPPARRSCTKAVFGLADVPEILAAVLATGRRTAVIVGAETDVCVAQSAIGLHRARLPCGRRRRRHVLARRDARARPAPDARRGGSRFATPRASTTTGCDRSTRHAGSKPSIRTSRRRRVSPCRDPQAWTTASAVTPTTTRTTPIDLDAARAAPRRAGTRRRR